MSQGTFWDGDEKPAPAAVAAAVEAAGPIAVAAAPQPKPAKRDFRLRPAAAPPEPQPDEIRDEPPITAEHIAAQLLRLWRRGIIAGASDPEAHFYCLVIRDFGATVVDEPAGSGAAPPGGGLGKNQA
jgi:hypothetical protein